MHRYADRLNGSAERTARGRFAVGNSGGPGRPKRATEATYLLTLSAACPPETWRLICQKAVEQALAGDASARAWLARYLAEGMTLNIAASLADAAGT